MVNNAKDTSAEWEDVGYRIAVLLKMLSQVKQKLSISFAFQYECKM